MREVIFWLRKINASISTPQILFAEQGPQHI